MKQSWRKSKVLIWKRLRFYNKRSRSALTLSYEYKFSSIFTKYKIFFCSIFGKCLRDKKKFFLHFTHILHKYIDKKWGKSFFLFFHSFIHGFFLRFSCYFPNQMSDLSILVHTHKERKDVIILWTLCNRNCIDRFLRIVQNRKKKIS